MNIDEIIAHKRDKLSLSREEISFFIKGYVNGEIADYQASALMMAIYLNGMNKQEISDLTDEMRFSGETWDLSDIEGLKVDKHSTGGVGDKVSLILGPMVAACGGKFTKMSGRGLGHTGGTLDKMESIPGLRINLSKEEFKKQVKEIGIAIIGQDKKLDPADKKMYALRDVTATIGSIPLISSSIMSKKLASGSDCILLDVKYGNGAFMKTVDQALKLAKTMVEIGKNLHKDVRAEITDMNQPLGCCVGNALEIKEVIQTLNGKGPKDLNEICLSSGALLLTMSKVFNNKESATAALKKSIEDGSAFKKFREFVIAQGGDITYIDNPEKFPLAKNIIEIKSKKSGYISKIDALEIGIASMKLGGGREKIEDTIDMSAGIILHKKIGDYAKVGETLCELHTNKNNFEEIISNVENAFEYSDNEINSEESITKVIVQ